MSTNLTDYFNTLADDAIFVLDEILDGGGRRSKFF